jgi:hypothetical protein
MTYSEETMKQWSELVDKFWEDVYKLMADKLREKDK